APKPAAGDSAVAQPTTGTFTDLVRARELTGDTPSRHIPLQRHAPRNKRRAPSSFVWRARRAGTLVTARSGAPLSLEIGPNFPLGITSRLVRKNTPWYVIERCPEREKRSRNMNHTQHSRIAVILTALPLEYQAVRE